MTREATIFVYLMDEGTDVWRPVKAIKVGNNLYRIVSKIPDPGDEKWQFSVGYLVKCEFKPLFEQADSQIKLAAVEKIEGTSTQ